MKITINLASQPFRRDRAMIVASSAVSALLVITLIVLIFLSMADSRQLASVRGEVSGLHQQISSLTAEQAKLDTVARKPENEDVLLTSVFINSLLMRKGISWNQIFTDLEKTIPYNVKVVRIRPLIDEQGRVVLDMIVAAENVGPVVDMLKKFSSNPLFGAVSAGGQLPPSQADPLFRYTLNVTYAQKL